MRRVRLGGSDLEVSPVCLGCMSFGTPGKGLHKWSLDERASRRIIRQGLESGINFFDTANVYSGGHSEEIVGRALADMSPRDDVVIATKVGLPMGDSPERRGLSRRSILSALDASLQRLGTDHVDLYIVHRLDPLTSVEETLAALEETVVSGKVRYLGASSMLAWQFAQMLEIQRANGWHRFVSMQNYYNLLYREEEREMVPLCERYGIGITPWSPLARGRLARPWEATTQRTALDSFAARLFEPTEALDRPVVEALAEVAGRRTVPMSQIALAWLLRKPNVASAVVGVTSVSQLSDACAAAELVVTEADVEALEAAYRPHPIAESVLNVQPRLRQS